MTDAKTIRSLEASLKDMHALASGSMERIRGMARCALHALESPRGARDLESIAEVLQAIALDAEIARDNVSAEAECQGIKIIDDAWVRRLQAMPNDTCRG